MMSILGKDVADFLIPFYEGAELKEIVCFIELHSDRI